MEKRDDDKDKNDNNLNLIAQMYGMAEKLQELDHKIEASEKVSKLGLEDQLFFGLVFSIGVLLITYPSVSDLSLLFEKSLGLQSFLASNLSYSLKLVIVLSLLLSGFLRYYGAIQENGFYKYLSLELVMFSVNFFFAFTINMYWLQFLELKMGSVRFLMDIVVTLVALYLGIVEARIIMFYVKIGQLAKVYPPFAHAPFVFGFGLTFFLEDVMLSFPQYVTIIANPILLAASVFARVSILFILMFAYVRFMKRLVREK
jgi:hypothetical protein